MRARASYNRTFHHCHRTRIGSALIDLDHNATTAIAPEVLVAMEAVARECPGNPGSRHAAGRVARRALEDAREIVASILRAAPAEVVFTSGGTEANNTALFGFSEGRQGAIALPAGEHPSIEMAVRRLESRGWQRSTMPLDSQGLIAGSAWNDLPWDSVQIATCLLAHNETGVVQSVQGLAELCAERRIPLHLDAVQAAGKIDVNFRVSGATSLSVGAHKFHGPRGIGALLVRAGARLAPLLVGGHQEREHRAGTEPVVLAVGMARALQLWSEQRDRWNREVALLRDRLEHQLRESCAPVVVHGHMAERLPNTLNIAFPGCDGEALLVALDLAGICCSMGSACASGSSEPAPVLLAMGCTKELARASLRFSLGRDNTLDEVDEAARRIAATVRRMRDRRAS